MPIPNDTSPEAEQVLLRLMREKTPAERVQMAARLTHEVRQASRRAIARSHPELSPREIEYRFIELHYGKELAEGVRAHNEARRHNNGA
jgi:hypothetical protein